MPAGGAWRFPPDGCSPGESLLWATKAALPWLMILLFSLIIITYVPQVSLFLPEFIDELRGFK